jgi:hypothetical protein
MATQEASELSQYVPGFKANLNLAPQQQQSKLIGCVDSDLSYDTTGEMFNLDDVRETDPEDVQTRVPDTPDKFIGVDRRVGMFTEYHDSCWFDNVDKVKEITDPTSTKMASLMAGQGRKRDAKIFAAGLGNAVIKADNTDTFTTQAMLAGQVIAANQQTIVHQDESIPAASGAYGLSIGKLIYANMLLDESEIEGERFIAVSSKEIQDLLQRVPATSKYYNEVQALFEGKIMHLMGFNFVKFASRRMLVNGSGYRRCMAWVKPAIAYRGRQITTASIRIRHDKSDTPQAYYRTSHAAGRRYDLGVVEVLTSN